jgi:6,7-dimethyl-8-ribityllumazine synthase
MGRGPGPSGPRDGSGSCDCSCAELRRFTLASAGADALIGRLMSLDAPSSAAIDGTGLRIAIAAARFNEALVDALVAEGEATLEAAGAEAPVIERVPGSAELPYAASLLADSGDFDAIIVLGVVIAGDTDHHRIIGDSTAVALQELSILKQVPIINGILVVNTRAQAEARCTGGIQRGREFAESALAMAQLKNKWTKKNP